MHPVYNHLSGVQINLVKKHFEEMLCNQHTVLAPNFVEELEYKYYQIKVVDARVYNIAFGFVFRNSTYVASFTYIQKEWAVELSDWKIVGEELNMNTIPNRALNKKLFKILARMKLSNSFTGNSCWIVTEDGFEILLMLTQKIMPLKVGGFIFDTDGEKITIELGE